MRFRRRRHLTSGAVTLVVVAATVLSGVVIDSSSAAPFAAKASVSPQVQYLGDSTGTTFTFTVDNTGTVDAIAAVQIVRPGRQWTITACPTAPAGWTTQRSDTMCRFRSASGAADDLGVGASSSDFQITANVAPGTRNVSGTWEVKVSKTNSLDKPNKLVAAASEPPGLGTTAYSFEVLDAVVDPAPVEPGDTCPPASRTGTTGSTAHTIVICGRNRTTGTLTPTEAQSSLAGTFLTSHGAFTSDAVAPTSTSVVLGSWADVTVTSSAGQNKTVIAKIGSANDRTSPVTTLTGYEAVNNGPAAPDAVDDADSVGENSNGATIDVLDNDTDPNNDPLTVTSVDTTGTDGLVTITNAGADVSYDPNGAFESLGVGETATDTFTYTISDGNGGTDTATVTITITGVNDAPDAVDDVKTVGEDSTGETINVLGNDTDPESDTLAVTAINTSGTLGQVTNNGTDVTYDPNGQFEALGVGQTATDTFSYTVSDGNGGTDTATVTVTITGAAEGNDPPVAVDDADSVDENSSATVDVLGNDTDADNDPLTVTAVDTTGTDGLVTITNAGADVTYDPNGAFESLGVGENATDTFTYTVSDGNGGTDTATVTITITGVNDAPTAVDDIKTVGEDSTGETITVLANDTDAESDTLAVTAINTTGTLGQVTNNGTDVTYDPNGQFEALGVGQTATDTFSYTVSDGNGGTDTATVTVTITGASEANNPPVGVDDADTVGEDSTGTTIGVLGNDTDPDPSHPNGAFESLGVGETDTDVFTYTVSDGNGGTDTATVTVTITGVNDAPNAVNDIKTVGEDSTGETISVLANDTDAESDTLAVTAINTTGTLGQVTNNGTDVTYDPNGQFEALGVGQTATDTFSYTVSDGNGGTDTATVTVTITGANEANSPPVAANDADTVGEDSTGATIGVLGNDTDPDNDTLAVTAIDTTGTSGLVTNNGTDVTYDPNGAFESLSVGETDTDVFTYTVSDGNGGTDTATVTVTITGVNDAPVIAALGAGAVAYTENDPATVITTTGTVTDLDSPNFATGTLTVDYTAGGSTADRLEIRNQGTAAGEIGVSGANVTFGGVLIGTFAGGSGTTPLVVTLNAAATPAATQALLRNITFRNVSDNPSTATRTVRFVLTDGDGGTSSPATRTITVSAGNDAPNAVNDVANVSEDSTGAIVNVLANDTDAENNTLAVTAIDTTGTSGQVTNNGTDVTYDPNGAFENLAVGETAADVFTYTVSDGNGGTDVATVTITITGVNDAPVIAALGAGSVAYTENDPATVITTTGTVTDVDSANFGTGTLTVDYTAGGSTADRLEIRNQGTGAGQIGVSGSNVSFGGVLIGTFTGGSGTTPLVVSLNTSATPAATQALVRNITYRNVSDNPSTATRTVRFVLTDGDGGTSAPATRTITVAAVNDAPNAVNDIATVGEDSTGANVNVLANDTDAENNTLAVTGINTTGTLGQVTNNGTDVTYDPNGQFEVLGVGQTATDTFSYTVSDGNGGTDTATVTITITGANEANSPPVAANDADTVSEDSTGATIGVLGNDIDPDNDTLAVTAVDTTGTSGLVTNNGTDVTYDPNGAFESLAAGQTDTDVFTYTVSDGNGGTDTATVTVTITGVNDAPVIAALEPGALAYTENAAPTPITATGTVADVDSANFSTGTLAVDYSAGGQAEDRLAIRNQGTGAGQIGVSAGNVTFGGVLIGTFTGGTGTTPLVITLNTSATPAATQALVRNITYANVSENPSTAARTARFVLTDGDGGTSAPATRLINVTTANDAPVIAAIEAGALAYTENAAPTPITATGTVADVDSANFSTGTLAVDYSAGGQAEDRLAIRNQGTGAGQIGVSAGNVTFAGVLIGTFTGGTGTTPLVVTLNTSATPAATQALVRNITYANVSENPSTAARTARFVLTDGDGGVSAPATRTITVAAVDDPPVAVNDSGSVLQNASAAAVAVLTNDTDVDAGPKTISSASDPANGTVVLTGGIAGAHTGLTYQPDPGYCNNPPGGAPDTFTYTLNGGSTATVSMTVNCVANVAPVIAAIEAGALAYVEGNPATVITASGTITDNDSANFDTGTLTIDYAAAGQAEDRLEIRNQGTGAGQIGVAGANVTFGGVLMGIFAGGTGTAPLIITLNAAATPAATQALLRNITYRNVSEAPSTATRTARFVVTDGDGGTSSPANRGITVAAVNDVPVVAAVEAGALAYSENAAATPITATGTVTDLDSANFDTGTLTIDFASGGQAEDRLEIRNQGTGAGQIGVSAANVTFGGVLIGTFTGGTGTTPLVITLNAAATPAATQALLRNITYRNVSDTPNVSPRIARFVLTDGDGGTSAPVTRQINVTAVNDAPVIAAIEAAPLPYLEGSPATVITASGTVTDADSANFATGTLTVDFSAGGLAEDRLEIRNQGTGAGQIGVSGANVTFGGVLIGTFTGGVGTTPLVITLNAAATPAATQALLRNITYRNVSVSPSTVTRTVRFVLTDGDGGTSAPATRNITISAVSAPPIVTTTAGSLAHVEGEAPEAIDPALTVTDSDSANLASATVQVTGNYVNGEDVLAVNAQLGITPTFNAATGTLTLVGTTTVANYQTVLRAVTYQNVSQNPSVLTRTVTFIANDGSVDSNTAIKGITVAGVNDAPAITAIEGTSLGYVENAVATVITGTGLVSDVDSADFATGTLTVDYSVGGTVDDRLEIRNQGTGAGQIGVSGANVTFAGVLIGTFTGGSGTTPLVVTLNAAATPAATQALLRNITYRNVSENPSTGARTVRFVLTDGDGGTSAPATRSIALSALNDPPVIAAVEAGALAYVENAAATLITATGTVSDVDSANLSTGTFTVDYLSGGQAEDRLAIRNQGAAAGQIGVSGANVNFGGVLMGTFAGGTGTTPLVVTLNTVATPAAVQALLRNITYANVSETPNTGTRTARFVVTDGDGGTSGPATRAINITAVDDAPVVTASAGSTPYTEQNPQVVVDAALTATDADSANATGATVTIVSPVAGDVLNFTTQGTITGVFSAGVLTLSGTATVAEYQAALRTVAFFSGSDAPGTSRTIGFRITTPVSSNTSNKTIAITQVNDPPVVNLDAAGVLTYPEQAAFTNTFGAAATIVDPDSPTLNSLTVTITLGLTAADSLRLNPAIAGFTSNYSAGVLTITRAGGTVAQFQDALRNVQFSNSSDDPDNRNDGTANSVDAIRTLSVVANDGAAGGTSSPVTRTLTIAPVNDAPGAPSVLPSTTGVRNTTLVAGFTTTEPHVVRSAVPFIGNAVDPDNLETAISVVPADSVATTSGGFIVLDATGNLRYEPPASGTLTSDTYGYALTDGTTASSPITFTVNLSGAVWYVIDQSIVGANGTAARPFATVAAALAAAPAGQAIHIRRGFGDGVLSGASVLGTGDKLLGEGVALTNTDVGSATAETLFPAGTKPILTASGADVVTLAATTTVAGVSINPDGAGSGVFGTAAAGVVLRSMDVTDTGVASTQPAIEMTGAGNGLTFTAPVSVSTSSVGALNLNGAALAGAIASISVSGTTTSPGINLATTTGTLTFGDVAVNSTGQPGIVLTNAGTVVFPAANSVVVNTGGAKGLDASGTNLATSVFDAIQVTGSGTGAVRLSSVTGTPKLGDGVGTDLSLATTSGATPALDIASSNTVTVDAAGTDTISATGGPAVDIRTGNGSTYAFDSVSSTNSANDGINLDANLTTPFTATAGAISGAAGIALDVNGGGVSADVTVGVSINDGTGPLSAEVTGRTGGAVTVSGSISDGADVGGGIAVSANTAGTTTFSGASKALTTGTSAAVSLTNNTGHTIAVTNGGLGISTTSGAGFAATGGGTVTVAGTANTITSVTGTALNVTSTSIGAADLTFRSIAANGAASGIILNSTGTTGNLSVTGTGAADSGGTIANTTGPGISLTTTDLVSFNNVRVQGSDRSGVQGVDVSGFSFTNGTITGAGDSGVDDNDSSIAFNTTAGGMNNNVDGVVTITGNTLTNARGAGIEIFQYAGTISNATISNNTISSSFDPALSKRSGIALNLFGSPTTVASLTTGTIANNTVTGFPSGDGIGIQGAQTSSSSAPAGTYGTPGGANVSITGNQVIGDTTNKINGFGIQASVTGLGQGNFSITNNGTVASPIRNMKSSAIAIGAAGTVTTYFVVTGNQISANNGFSTAGIALGTDKNIQADLSTLSNPTIRATISNNSIANTSGSGIRVLHRDSNGTLNLRVESNTITNVLGNLSGIRVENGSSGNVAFNPTLCANIANNAAGGGIDFGDQVPGINVYKGSASASTYVFGLVGLSPSPATNAQVETYGANLNPASVTGTGFYAGRKFMVRTGSNYTSCTLPAGM